MYRINKQETSAKHTKGVVEAMSKGYEIKKKNLNIVIYNIETVLFHIIGKLKLQNIFL